MTELIDKMLKARFNCKDPCIDYLKTNYSNDTDESLEECLEQLFKTNLLGITQWDIYGDTLFESPSFDTGYVVAAWIEDGDLETYHLIWRLT